MRLFFHNNIHDELIMELFDCSKVFIIRYVEKISKEIQYYIFIIKVNFTLSLCIEADVEKSRKR